MPMASVNPVQEEQKQKASPLENAAKILGIGVGLGNMAASIGGVINPAPAAATGKDIEALGGKFDSFMKVQGQPQYPNSPSQFSIMR